MEKVSGSFCFGEQGLETVFVDLQHDACVAVGDLADAAFGSGTEELGDLGWGELVVVRSSLLRLGSSFKGAQPWCSRQIGNEKRSFRKYSSQIAQLVGSNE